MEFITTKQFNGLEHLMNDSYLVELFNEDIKNLLLDYYSCEKEDLIEAIKDAYPTGRNNYEIRIIR